MIYVDRNTQTLPAILADATAESGGPYETEAAITFYKKRKNRGRPFPYKIYSHPDVKRALEALFHFKCAYCESLYMHVHPTDVEHWRPKGEVKTDKKETIKPGYYWLAADWDNLFPSCIDCNRQRYYEVGAVDGKPVLLGKKNSFPLEKGSRRAKTPGQEKKERPLLLNPCRDKPLEYLEFPTDDSRRGVVRAKTSAQKRKLAKAEASIPVYALNRPKLVWARKSHYILIQAQMRRVAEAAARVKAARSARARNNEKTIYDREFEVLLAFDDDKSPYALMAKQLIAEFIRSRR